VQTVQLLLQFLDLKSIGPLQGNTLLPGYTIEVIDYFFRKLTACGERDVFLLYRCVHSYLFYLFADMIITEQIDALIEDLLHPFFANTPSASEQNRRYQTRICIESIAHRKSADNTDRLYPSPLLSHHHDYISA